MPKGKLEPRVKYGTKYYMRAVRQVSNQCISASHDSCIESKDACEPRQLYRHYRHMRATNKV